MHQDNLIVHHLSHMIAASKGHQLHITSMEEEVDDNDKDHETNKN